MRGMVATSFADRLLLPIARGHSRLVLRRFLNATQRATIVQREVLLSKIRLNADSDYGRAHDFARIRRYEDFKRQVPLQTYDDFEPYIERLRRGERQALFGSDQRVRMFALTSGTSSRPKHIPVTDRFLREFRAGWNAFGVKALLDHPENFLRPILQITSRMDENYSEAGIPCGAITGLMAATQKKLVRKYYITPLCVSQLDDPLARYYTIMRLAVPVAKLGFIVTANPATPLRLAKTAAQYAQQLVRDIHDGTLWGELDVPAAVRAELSGRLRPNASRALCLQQLLDEHGELLPRHYWELGFMCNWTGGTLGMYLRQFPHYFGDTPVRDIGLIASEGRMSIPIHDGTPAGILDIATNFYEFIPAGQVDRLDPDCLRSHELQVGDEYFIVLTNSAGLYRYCIGDRIRVTGYYGEAPLIEFLSKGAHVCSLAGEKLTEHQAVTAVNRAAAARQLALRSYVLAPQWDDPPWYRLHVEFSVAPPPAVVQQFTEQVDQMLGKLNVEYRSKQKTLRLGQLGVNPLPEGFLENRDQAFSTRYRRNNEQYKHQFLLTHPGEDDHFPSSPVAYPEPHSRVTLLCDDFAPGAVLP